MPVARVAFEVAEDTSTDAPEQAGSGEAKPPAEKVEKQAKPPREKPSRRTVAWIAGPVAVFLVLVGLIFATGTPSAGELMKDATASFGEVSRGSFLFKISIIPEGDAASASSIELKGPFEIVPGKDLPKARITYTVSGGGRGQTVELLTTGDKAYTVVGGKAYELPASATKELKSATADLSKEGGGGGLSGLQLNFDKWLVDPQVASGREIDGTATWQTKAGVNIAAAMQDLVKSAASLGSITGSQVAELKKSDLEEIEKGLQNAKVTLYVGKYDRIIRLMDLTMDFTTPEGATAATGGVTGGKMNLVIGISEPNQPVDVAAPKNPLPYSALESLAASESAQSGTALDDGDGK